MTKQAEVNKIICGVALGGIQPSEALKQLSGLGVVIRGERDLPEQVSGEIDEVCERYALRPNYANQRIGEILDKAGLVPVEPLTKEC